MIKVITPSLILMNIDISKILFFDLILEIYKSCSNIVQEIKNRL